MEEEKVEIARHGHGHGTTHGTRTLQRAKIEHILGQVSLWRARKIFAVASFTWSGQSGDWIILSLKNNPLGQSMANSYFVVKINDEAGKWSSDCTFSYK